VNAVLLSKGAFDYAFVLYAIAVSLIPAAFAYGISGRAGTILITFFYLCRPGATHDVMRTKKFVLTATLLFACCAVGQHAPSNLQGSWIATAAGGSLSIGGRWSARVLPADKNAANGSWELVNERNQVVLEGSWSARKLISGWQGTWLARTQQNKTVSGRWEAAMAGFKDKTFQEMLQWTMEKQIAGSWQSGRAQGNWWLQH
jgi:hypothetical protein